MMRVERIGHPQAVGEDRRTHLRQHLEEIEVERRAMLEHSGVAMLFVQPTNGRVCEANQAAVELTQYSEDNLIGIPVDRLVREYREPGQDAAAKTPRFTAPRSEIVHVACRTGRPCTARCTSCVIKRGGKPLALLFLSRCARSGGDGEQLAFLSTQPAVREPGATIDDEFPEIIGASQSIRTICRLIGKVARTDTTVLIQGESGTGKEVFAKTIHYHSPRAKRGFVRINCAALTETLLEGELFGHVRGAFTGAVRDRKGRFREADGGTILLDEIGSMSLSGQSKLLRVLQEREFERVGSSKTESVNVRVVATTNVDLNQAVKDKMFREDLFYRLSVITVDLPPLRDRKEDIPLLAATFAKRFNRHLDKKVYGFYPEAIEVLLGYHWPGNVRELENVVERAVVIEDDELIRPSTLALGTSSDMGDGSRRVRNHLSLREKMNVIEKHIVSQTLQKTNWVRKQAALDLGIDPRNLNYFLRKHDIRDGDLSKAHVDDATDRLGDFEN